MAEVEFTSITTRAGDEGKTSLINGERRYKSEHIFDLLGSIDELSSALGLVRTGFESCESKTEKKFYSCVTQIKRIQNTLVILGGIVATPSPIKPRSIVSEEDLLVLEQDEKFYMQDLHLKGFILPGACEVSARLDLARSICRRVERVMVRFIQESQTAELFISQRFINRLSDYLFVLARWVCRIQGIDEFS